MVEMKKSAQGHIDKIVTVRPNMTYVTARILMQATPEYLATHKSEPIAWQSPRYEVFTICSSWAPASIPLAGSVGASPLTCVTQVMLNNVMSELIDTYEFANEYADTVQERMNACVCAYAYISAHTRMLVLECCTFVYACVHARESALTIWKSFRVIRSIKLRKRPALQRAVIKVPVVAQKSMRYLWAHEVSRSVNALSNFKFAHAGVWTSLSICTS